MCVSYYIIMLICGYINKGKIVSDEFGEIRIDHFDTKFVELR